VLALPLHFGAVTHSSAEELPRDVRLQVANSLSREFSTLLHFVKEDLARQEYVMNVANEELQAALNVVLEENMYLGQVLFYCLDRLFLQVSLALLSYFPLVCI
jgi:hypothetical protein